MANPQETRHTTTRRMTVTRREAGVTAVAAIFAATTTGLIGYELGRGNSNPSIPASPAGITEQGTAAPSISPSGKVDFTPTPKPSDASGTPNPSEAAGTPNPDTLGQLDVSVVGKDAYSKDSSHWKSITDADGKVVGEQLLPNPNGRYSIVTSADRYVVQAYVDANVKGSNPAIAVVFGTGIEMPIKGASFYSEGAVSNDKAVEIAFDGQLALEITTQPNVFVAEVCDATQALPENKQDLSNSPAWEAQKLTPEKAASLFGRDEWSKDASRWHATPDGYGMILDVNPDGSSTVIETVNAVAQAYWDTDVEGAAHQAIAVTVGANVELPVKGATVYYGVPQGMGRAVADYAHKQAVNLEIDTQPGVYAIEVCKAAKAVPDTGAVVTAPTTSPEATTKPVVATPAPTPEATTRPVATQKPEATPKPTAAPDWRIPFEKAEGLTDRAKLLADGGLKIVYGVKPVRVTINGNEQIQYWNGTKVVTKNGPASILVNEATVYKTK